MGKDFLLNTPTAETLFYNYAEKMPIFDFHNHLSPKEIYENKNYASITELWLAGDHYKWRAMRAAGVDEKFITGNASDLDKFAKWAKTIERLPGSPLYHWAHLELSRYFGIEEPLTSLNAEAIFKKCGEMLKQPDFTPVNLLKKARVEVLCTTDDPFDSLEWHFKLKDTDLPFKVHPTFRPDKVLHIADKSWPEYIRTLATSVAKEISDLDSLKEALAIAVSRFKLAGCLASDHGFEFFRYNSGDAHNEKAAKAAFRKAFFKDTLVEADIECFESYLLLYLGELYTVSDIRMQLHMGAARNFNTSVFKALGPDCGIDSVGVPTDPFKLGSFLDDLNSADHLPKTILYCLNPADNPVLTSLAVSFCNGDFPGKVQTGSAWWFNDTLDGIRTQLNEAAQAGLLGVSVGMLTDSRSVSSFVRHEYYRRILCDFIGNIVENGEYPADLNILGPMVQDICFNNANRFFSKGAQ